jgi:hypothetical protein
VTYMRDGTEYLDSREMRIWKTVKMLNDANRTTNSSQVARLSRDSAGIVTNVCHHLKTRGFLKNVSGGAAYHWRTTDRQPETETQAETGTRGESRLCQAGEQCRPGSRFTTARCTSGITTRP